MERVLKAGVGRGRDEGSLIAEMCFDVVRLGHWLSTEPA